VALATPDWRLCRTVIFNLITSNTNSAIEITIGKIQITVSDATSPVLLKMVLQVAADVK